MFSQRIRSQLFKPFLKKKSFICSCFHLLLLPPSSSGVLSAFLSQSPHTLSFLFGYFCFVFPRSASRRFIVSERRFLSPHK
jgi:hypothetical protein